MPPLKSAGAQGAKTAITYFPAPEEMNGVQLFDFSDLQFDDPDQVDRNGPLSGSLKFKILVPSKGKFGLRLWYRGTANRDSEMSYYRTEGTLPEVGRMHFDFRPFAKSDTAKEIQGPVRLYVTLCNEAYRNRRTDCFCSDVVEQVVNVPSE